VRNKNTAKGFAVVSKSCPWSVGDLCLELQRLGTGFLHWPGIGKTWPQPQMEVREDNT